MQLQPKLEIANVLNVNPVLNQVTTFGSSLGRPNTILQARVARVVVHVKF